MKFIVEYICKNPTKFVKFNLILNTQINGPNSSKVWSPNFRLYFNYIFFIISNMLYVKRN